MEPDFSKMSFSQLLDEALRLAEELDKTITGLFPGARTSDEEALKKQLVGLSIDEKLALGEEAARRMAALAFQVAPGAVLDSMEAKLPEHIASRAETAEVLMRMKFGS